MREIGLLIRLHLYNKDNFLQLSSFIISIPSSLAFFNFEPDFSPAINMSVDLLMLETTLAPSFSAIDFASALDIEFKVPVKIIFFPVIGDLTVFNELMTKLTSSMSDNI